MCTEAQRTARHHRYMSDAPGFTGSLKARYESARIVVHWGACCPDESNHRYSDFCVNEINLDGSVVHLREQLHPPRAPKVAARACASHAGAAVLMPHAPRSQRSRVPEESAGAAEEAGALPSQGDGGGGGGDAGSAPTAADVDAEGGTTAGLGVGASVHPAAADHAGSASDGTTGAAKHAEHAQQLQEFEAVAGTAAAAMLRDFLNAATAATPVEQVPAMLFPPSEDKHYRRALHEAVKRLFPFLVGDTADDPAGSAGKCECLQTPHACASTQR